MTKDQVVMIKKKIEYMYSGAMIRIKEHSVIMIPSSLFRQFNINQ
jgi:hypothetical protein